MFALHLKSASSAIIELVESQRFYGVAWGPPMLLVDPPAWGDRQGGSVAFGTGRHPPSIDGEQVMQWMSR